MQPPSLTEMKVLVIRHPEDKKKVFALTSLDILKTLLLVAEPLQFVTES